MRGVAYLAVPAAVPAAVAALAGLGAGLVNGQSPRPGGPGVAGAAPGTRYSSPEGLQLFHRARSSQDDIPDQIVRGLVLSDGIADPAAARRVAEGTAEGGWLVPGRADTVCHVRNGFATCPPRRVIEQRGAAPSLSFRDDRFLVDGIAADGVDSVDVTYETGETSSIPVADNAFHGEGSRPAVRVAWTGPHGRETMDFSGFVSSLRRLQRTAPRNLR